MKTSLILFVTTVLLASSLATTAEEAAGKLARRPFAAIDLAKTFTAGPLSDPQPPSTLLPAGATSLELKVRAATPTLCRYSVGQDLPFGRMTPFDAQQPSSLPATVICGLDPDPSKVNDVYVRCAAAPGTALHLQYRSLPAAKPGFPRTANLWGSYHFTGQRMEHASRIDLWLGADFNTDQIRQLRRLNPNCFILTSINTVENNDVPDEYFLRDTTGRKIEVWPGAFRLNLTRPEVAEYQARYAYQKVLKSGLMVDGCFFDNFMMSQRWLTHDIYDRPVQLDAEGSGKASNKDQFDKAWRAGVFRELREWRKLMPWALTTGHSQGYPYPEIAEIFNGQGIGFYTADVIEGQHSFHELWDYYKAWTTLSVKPAITSVESAVPNQIAYGYDYRPQRHAPPATWDFARDYYPYMRFGLAFTLMSDGYFSHELGDTDHGQDWWYDELDFKLGEPLGAAQPIVLRPAAKRELPENGGDEVFRRDFLNGIVLLNGTRHRRTVDVGDGYARLNGEQAPKYQYILDDGEKETFRSSGAWQEVALGTKKWHAIPPYYHAWNNRCHILAGGVGEATWDLTVRGRATYTIQAWWAAALGAKQWTKQAVYELVADGKVVATKTLDQSEEGDQWHTIVERIELDPGSKPLVRVKSADGGILVADALHVLSAERYNDGESVRQVTLEPMDGIVLRRIGEAGPIKKIEPPEKGFYAKELDYHGLPIKGAAVVSDAAFYEAWRRVDNLLRHNPIILQNLLGAGSEVHIIGKDQTQTDLPEFRSQKGVPLHENPRITLDERARGMGGRECSCGEENLLKLPGDRYRGRDILSHEFTHTIHGFGVSKNVRELVTKTYHSAREKKLWETPGGTPIYAGTNENEYLAELALWYVGGRGDWPRGMPPMQPGPEFIKKYDPEGYKLVDDLFSGRLDVQPLSPRSRRGRVNH